MGKNLNQKKRKILYVSGTRAEYGLMRETLLAINQHPKLSLEIAVCGMHLMPQFGLTINEIRKDKFFFGGAKGTRPGGGFQIHKIAAIYKEDNKESMAKFLGDFVLQFTQLVKRTKPDIILVQGDRAEMLAAATVGAYLTIPVAHTHGGDVTSTVDEFARHAITKLSHIHLPATKKSADRIIKMGEEAWRVFVVGAPGLDSILNKKLVSQEILAEKYNLDFSKPVLLALQHPVTTEADAAPGQIKETLEALRELGHQTILIYPNADAGGRAMIKVIERYKKHPFLNAYQNIPSEEYLSLLKNASCMVGNSSSGIIESIPFGLPVVNIGQRELGRERSTNVIDAGHNKKEIKNAILKVLENAEFTDRKQPYENPYGDGKTGKKIADILANIKIDKKLLQKQITY